MKHYKWQNYEYQVVHATMLETFCSVWRDGERYKEADGWFSNKFLNSECEQLF